MQLNKPLLNLAWFHMEWRPSPVGWVTSLVVMIAPLLLTTIMGDELLLDRATDEGLGRILLGCTCWVIILTPAEEQEITDSNNNNNNNETKTVSLWSYWWGRTENRLKPSAGRTGPSYPTLVWSGWWALRRVRCWWCGPGWRWMLPKVRSAADAWVIAAWETGPGSGRVSPSGSWVREAWLKPPSVQLQSHLGKQTLMRFLLFFNLGGVLKPKVSLRAVDNPGKKPVWPFEETLFSHKELNVSAGDIHVQPLLWGLYIYIPLFCWLGRSPKSSSSSFFFRKETAH